MSEAVLQTIELVRAQVGALEQDLAEKKRMVNSLCKLINQPPFYSHVDEVTEQTAGIRNDEFYGQPLASVVRSILVKRKAASSGAATVGEIYAAMCQGNFNFETDVAENAKRNLRISLTKNSTLFHKLPNGRYGLREWYPNLKERRSNGDRARPGAEDEPDETGEANAPFPLTTDSEPIEIAVSTDSDESPVVRPR